MNDRQILFIVVNLVGGILVLVSYVWGARGGGADLLWGGVPESSRGLYIVSMLLSAASFFVFTTYILFKVLPGGFVLPGSWDTRIFILLYAFILIPSALWMPLTSSMVSNPTPLTWVLIRTVLALVAFASLGVLAILYQRAPRPGGIYFWSSVVGVVIFFLHTGILDALIWPYFFKK